MELTDENKKISISLTAMLCFTFKYLSPQQKSELVKQHRQQIMKHACYDNEDHIQGLIKFLQNGGNLYFPCKDDLIIYFLSRYMNDGFITGKIITSLIQTNPQEYSPLFWRWWQSKVSFENLSDNFTLLSFICTNSHIQPPNNEILFEIRKFCERTIKESKSFANLESALMIYKWIIKNKAAIPEFDYNFKQSNLKALAISCYAEYARYGDLSKLPVLPRTNEPGLRNAYAEVILNVCQNPNYSMLKIDHPIWNAIRSEFIDNNFICERCNILSLTIDELDVCINLSHLLPAYFFIYAMRASTKNIDKLKRMITLVCECPQPVLTTHIDEFCSFIQRIIEKMPILATHLANSIRKLIIPLRKYIGMILTKLHPIDFFNTEELCAKFIIIETLISLSRDMEYFVDDLDCLWEILPTIRLSQSFCVALFNYFHSIAMLSNKCNEFANLAICSILPVFGIPMPPNLTPLQEKFFRSSSNFCAISIVDIISNPMFDIRNSFPLIGACLRLICSCPPNDNELTKLFIPNLPKIATICPAEATAAANKYTTVFFKKYKSEILQFYDFVKQFVVRTSNIPFIMQASIFQTTLSKFTEIEQSFHASSDFFQLTDDINESRLAILMNSDFSTFLLSKPDQISILLEQWYTGTPVALLNTIKTAAAMNKDPRETRYFREFINAFGISQPPYDGENNWVKRTFVDDIKVEKEPLSDILTQFPVETDNKLNSISTFINEHMSDEGNRTVVCHLLEIYKSDLSEVYGNEFWFLKSIVYFGLEFPQEMMKLDFHRDLYALAILTRRHLLTPTTDENFPDWLNIDMLRMVAKLNQSQIETISSFNSLTLNLKFWSKLNSPPDFKVTLPSSIMHSVLTFVGCALRSEDEFKEILKNNSDQLEAMINGVDWRNPTFFTTVLNFTVSLFSFAPNIDKFYRSVLGVLVYISRNSTAPIFEASNSLQEIAIHAGVKNLPKRLGTGRFEALRDLI
ncbi:hypothetical protein TVAG_199770 [Trichomonas vaginalis G3]|uniref:Uncharacterized protein n=1 Tax=Trichomonas vaginalis (strain ATCC PRA-98 / G3) TaxID=412133 RepID=A2FPG8_TRIV3|nr:hypothetical protein TVAGG3_0029540 [Trichomonas vaginalis G3]EAX93203.1 hypothetical protein TVAG_199770 [Trichomonas vaginalis G3]KAI5540030.1 hypothetical protein TVAGG3_0029540 [Trichomonas vaginalis G3]|eukprot:XP_001306133.1 hypothetical protein [Trichomonas vaginalis G3]